MDFLHIQGSCDRCDRPFDGHTQITLDQLIENS